jgi:3-phenylpropionate/cinnamic acid dioxygenase small subunit
MTETNGGSIPFRVQQLEQRVQRIEDWRSDWVDPNVTRQSEQMKQISEEVKEMRSELRGVRRAFTTFSISIATSSIVFGLTILSATGKI